MFRSLGLFASAPCPDSSCHRPHCFFNHGESSRYQHPKASATPRNAPVSKAQHTLSQSGRSPSKPGKDEDRVSSSPSRVSANASRDGNAIQNRGIESPAKKIRLDESKGKGTPAAAVVNSSSSGSRPGPPAASSLATPPAPKSQPLLVRKPAATEVVINPLRPPSIPTNIKLSPQPWADRQKGLQTLFQQFTKLYRPILRTSPEIAHTSALAQEAEVSASSANLKSYKSAIHHAAVSISRRAPPDSPIHPSVGTVKESRTAYENLSKDLAGRLTKDKVKPYLLPLDQFKLWGYPDPTNIELTKGGDEPDLEGTEQTCSRCKKPFMVSSKDLDKRFGECDYHHGKIQPERIEGRRKWIYTCCRKERGEVGCEKGVHVYTDGDDDEKLAKRREFRTVKQIWDETSTDSTMVERPNGDSKASKAQRRRVVDVVGMDCEMIYTTAGSSLARVTIMDQAGEVLLDEKVRQAVPILDINTRFSGIHPGELDNVIMDLPAVRSAACVFIGPDTVIVGHGLENDLRALRLLHDKVVDTAIIFPHGKGAPYRRALRDLVKEKLGYFIQEHSADVGHSSAEDAKATLEVLKWKVREDAE